MKDDEKLKKEKESNYLRLVVIIALLTILILGKGDIRTGTFPEGTESVSSLTLPRKGNLKNFKDDFINYVVYVKKLGFTKTHRENYNLVSDIHQGKERLEELKQEEEQLQALINNVPVEVYEHNKLDLTAFIVEELKSYNLVYAIKYNYDFNSEDGEESEESGESEESEEGEESEESEESEEQLNPNAVTVTDAFAVRVYQIDQDDNYNKVLNVLDTMFIREPYEILKIKVGYDEISKSYYLEFAIGI